MDIKQFLDDCAEWYIEIWDALKRIAYAMFWEIIVPALVFFLSPLWIIPYIKWFYIPESHTTLNEADPATPVANAASKSE